jgi:hypothetical protein
LIITDQGFIDLADGCDIKSPFLLSLLIKNILRERVYIGLDVAQKYQ